MRKNLMKDIQEPILQASPQVQRIIARVLEAERDKLYLDRPHLVSDVVRFIEEEVK
ncbi:MAG: hypothetical protein ACM3X4_06505 [Ignavibacteriales bacterium]